MKLRLALGSCLGRLIASGRFGISIDEDHVVLYVCIYLIPDSSPFMRIRSVRLSPPRMRAEDDRAVQLYSGFIAD